MKSFKFWGVLLAVLIVSGLFLSANAFAADGNDTPPPVVQVSDPVTPKLSRVMRDVVYVPPVRKLDREEINPIKNPGLFLPDLGQTGTDTKLIDPLVAVGLSPQAAPSPLSSFEGQGDFALYSPPDTTGDVGPSHFVQMVNVETAIYDKSGNLLINFTNDQLWDGFGGVCENNNDGDPIVLYDDLADRWLLSQFAVPSGSEAMCFAISQNEDPTGAYYLYEFPMPDFPDYPKIGVWSDGYYLGTNSGFPNAYYAHVFDRVAMLAGNPAGHQYVGGQANFLMPADSDGSTPPPAGEPGVFYTFYKGGYANHPPGVDRLALYEFDVDWATPANSSFSLAQELPIAAFNYTTCGFFNRDCLDQLNTTNKLDAVDPWPMVRLQYRNFGSYQAMVGNFTVDVDGTDHAGIRWFELRKSSASWSLHQEGTYAPDAHNRFMGSIAMDGSGNLALGYSITSATMYPSIRYTVHAAGDPAGTMQAEAELMAGGGSQTSSQRWGDYSATVVDPTDNCTFWITNMYHNVQDTGFSWNTRVGTFRVPGCTGSLGYVGMLDGVVTDDVTTDPIASATVAASFSLTQTFSATSNGLGEYVFNALPVGTYTVTASAFGYLPETISSVSVLSGTTTTVDFALTPAAASLVSGYVTDSTTGWPLYASIDIDGYPGGPLWTDPETGYYEVSLPDGASYTFDVAAWVPGYLPDSVSVGPLAGDTMQDFALNADLATCEAPGYELNFSFTEDFEANNGGFTHSGTNDVWAWGVPVTWPTYCGSGINCWGTNLNGTYPASTDMSLISPVIDLSGYSAPSVDWLQAWHIESATWDHAYAEVSINGGAYIPMWSHTGGTLQQSWQEMSYDLSAAAGSTVTFRFRMTSDSSVQYNGYYIDRIRISDGCVAPTGGLVVGNVYDDNTSVPLNGAMVANEAGFMAEAVATPFDDNVDDGFFTAYSPAGTLAFTATMDGGYAPEEIDVNVVAGNTVLQDFDLAAALLETVPMALHVTVDMGEVLTETIDLNNSGLASTDFAIGERDGGFDPLFAAAPVPALPVVAPAQTGTMRLPNGAVDCDAYQNYALAEPDEVAAACGTAVAQPWAVDAPQSPTDIGFAQDIGYISDNFVQFALNDFPGQTVVGTNTNAYYGIDFDQTATVLYALNDTDDTLGTINLTTGAYTPLVPCVSPSGSWTGLSIDPTSGVFFASDATNLYTINPATGAVTLVGPFGAGVTLMIEIAVGPDGQMYGHAIDTDSIYSIDKTTGAASLIGATGYNGNFAQGMDFDNGDGTLYIFLYIGSGANVYGTVNLATGAVTPLATDNPQGEFEGAIQVAANLDVPWLSEDPTTGTAASLSSQEIQVIFDASVAEVTQPGDYMAELHIANDSPYGALVVPVTMTVLAPPNYAQISGTVTGLGYCDDNPAALEGAQVVIEGATGTTTLTTDAMGYYTYSLDESEAPLMVSVTAADHADVVVSGISLTAGQTTTQDFDLRVLEACVSVDPAAMEVTLATGDSMTLPLDLINAGAMGTAFELQERPVVLFSPLADLIVDGSFEAGTPNPNWAETSTNFGTPLCDAASCGLGGGTAGPRTGDWWVWAGGIGALEEASVAQNVVIPVGTADLSFYFWIGTTGGVSSDYFSVQIDGTEVFRAGADEQASYSTYTLVNVDISDYADGNAHEVMFYGYTNNAAAVNFNLDDVALESTAGGLDVPWLSTDPITGTVVADSTQIIDVTFDTMTYTVGTYTAMLRVNTDDMMHPTISIPVTMTIEAPRYGVDLAPASDSLMGMPGETVTYTLSLTNTGNTANTFALVDSGGAWDVALSMTSVMLDPGESADFMVMVTVPMNAGNGDSDMVTITASGAGGATASSELTTEAMVSMYQIYLPLIFR